MLFNCLNCCKSISSLNRLCPYCMVEIDYAVESMNIARKPMTLEAPTMKERLSLKAHLLDMMDKTVFNVTQLLHFKRISKTRIP